MPRKPPNAPSPATAPIADACIRDGIPFRFAPPSIRPLFPSSPVAGPALAVKHVGSVDVFLEAFNSAKGGEVLVIDNEERHDEGCIGDLTAIEAQDAGVLGAVIWGRHRDSAQIQRLGFPVFSLGPFPSGPNRKTVAKGTIGQAQIGPELVRSGDYVFADADGVVFIEGARAKDAINGAREITERETAQANAVKKGTNLRTQFRFDEFLKLRAKDPSYTLRAHLRRVRAEIEV